MVRRRASDASSEAAIGRHTLRGTGFRTISRMAAVSRLSVWPGSNAKTTGLYDPRSDNITVGEAERIGISLQMQTIRR